VDVAERLWSVVELLPPRSIDLRLKATLLNGFFAKSVLRGIMKGNVRGIVYFVCGSCLPSC